MKEGSLDKVLIHQDLMQKKRDTRRNLVKYMQERKTKGEVNLIIVNVKIVERRMQNPKHK